MLKQPNYHNRGQYVVAGCLAAFVQTSAKEFVPSDFQAYCEARGVRPKVVLRHMANLLKGFSSPSAGVIEKTNRFKMEDTFHSPAPIWRVK